MKYLTIDVGGTEIKYAIIDEEMNFSYQGYTATPRDTMENFLDVIYAIYEPVKDEVECIAMSLPGFVDSKTGYQYGGGILPYLVNECVTDHISNRCGCKVHIENDGKAAALAEYWKGSLVGCKDCAVFIIGTGCGGGLIIDGKLLKGRTFTAGEYSFMVVNEDLATEGIKDSMMCNRCSTRYLLSSYKDYTHSEEEINGREFFRRVHAGDQDAMVILERFGINVATQILNLGILLNVEKVAIGGGISRQDILLEKINEGMEKISAHQLLKKYNGVNMLLPEIVRCKFGNEANLIGAIYSMKVDEKEAQQAE